MAFFEDGVDHEALAHSLGVVDRARGGMSKLAKETGISRQRLYKAIAKDGNPSFETVMNIVGAFGVRLSEQTAPAATIGDEGCVSFERYCAHRPMAPSVVYKKPS